MKYFLPTLVCWGWVVSLGWGQVEVDIVLEQNEFLADESLPVAVRVVNRSGQKLVLGGRKDWLEFLVESREGLPVPKQSDPPVEGEFTVESSASATKHLDLMPYFKLSSPGRYQVLATVRVAGWDRSFTSTPVGFDIGKGTTIWEQDFGIPQAEGAPEGAPEVRKYALQQANYLKRPTLYVRLTDARGLRVFQVLALGPLVSFSRPEHLIDRGSNLHVLFQTGARTFRYCEVSPEGQWIKRHTYQYFRTRPVLRSKEGEVAVSGGMRVGRRDDLPRPEPEVEKEDGNTETP